MKRIIIYLIGIVVIVLIFILIKLPFLLKSEVTEGIVIRIEKTSIPGLIDDLTASYYPVIQFKTDNNIVEFYGPENAKYELGEIISIRYKIDEPEKSRINNLFGIFFDSTLILPGVLFLLWSAFIFSFLQKNSNNSD